MKTKVQNWWYLVVGLLFVLFAVSHTLNGVLAVLPRLSDTTMGADTKTVFEYVWHIIGIENLVLGAALIIMAFYKNIEKVRFTAWVIIAVLIVRWAVIAGFTALHDSRNIPNLLPDTLAIALCVVLLCLGSRAKTKV
ncbi:MAG: hypothetical protein LBU90_01585 [Bacteroidales bacterium]|nr:hypothetical protein [Bacteroidales bacterium]